MKKEIMGMVETSVAASNIEAIEYRLGHKIPSGMVDVTELGDHLLSMTELSRIVTNLQSVEATMKARKDPKLQKINDFELVFEGILVIPIVLIILYAFISYFLD